MTAYFDQVHDEINALDPKDISTFGQSIDQIETRLVFDCTVCAQWTGFPEDLRRRVHETILKYGSYTLPVNAPQRGFDTLEEVSDLLHKLCWELHSIFHDLCILNLYGFSDDPRMPLRVLYTQGEEVREQMIAPQPPDKEG